MTIMMCESHGRQPGEKVSKRLLEKFQQGHDISDEVRDFAFVIEDYECPFFGLEEEIQEIPEVHDQGAFQVETDERLSELLGRVTVMCLACLKGAMNGRPLPDRFAP